MKLAGRRTEDRPSMGKRPPWLVLADQPRMAEACRGTPATRGTLRALLALTAAAVVLAGCATAPESTANDTSASALAARALERRDNTGIGDFNTTTPPGSVVTGGTVIPGTGSFINQDAARAGIVTSPASGDVTLNFELADLRDVVKVIFDTLEENYVIDPAVQGVVTVQTSRPLPRDALIPTLESLLRMNGAALIQSGGLYRIVPANSVLASGLVAPSAGNNEVRPGYGVRIIPLKYISATEMEKILLPFAPEGGVVSVDNARSLIMLSGTSRELASLEQTVNIFDVNWLKGMSVGIYRLENIDAASAAEELGAVFGEGGDLPISGMLRFVPVSQLNSLLVITPQQEYLKDVQGWIDRLDGGGGERLYVYDVENGQAGYLADVLNNVFGGGGGGGGSSGSAGTTGGDVAPGLESTSMSSDDSFGSDQGLGSGSGGGLDEGGDLPDSTSATASMVDLGGEGSGLAFPGEDVRIVADEENNSLLIWATDRTYHKILDALRRVDVQPRQVLVEVTVAEVTLAGRLRYGLQWFFKNDVGNYGGGGVLGLPPGTTVSSLVEGAAGNFGASDFAYAITDNAGVIRALFQALESDNSVNVLSSPQVMVVDNQTASIRVGNQEPVQGSTTITDGGNQINSIQFKDTGVLLKVRPRVNSSGQVTMDVRQQVIDKGAQDEATEQFAFFERSVESRVVVSSGETIILGGLISETRRANQAGIPVLYKVPILGPLFGQVNNENNRTELIVLITPRIVRDGREAQQVTEELKQRMRAVTPYVESAGGLTGG